MRVRRLPFVVLVAAPWAIAMAQAEQRPLPLEPLDDAAWLESRVPASIADAVADATMESARDLLIAAPNHFAPEEALPLLAEHAAGDDPDLAPLAAQAALRIATELEAHSLSEREATVPAESIEAFETIASDASARADIRAAASWTAARLRSLRTDAVPAVPSPPE